MSSVAWLDHDFPLEHVPDPPGLLHVGNFLGVDVYELGEIGAAPAVAPDRATGDPTQTCPGSGSPALVADRHKARLLEELVDVLLPKPGQFYSYLLGELRRHHVDNLNDLPVEVLFSVVQRALMLHNARGGR